MHILMILSLLSLAGCSSYQEQFDCAPGSGVGCKSLSEIDQMVESGKLPLGDQSSLVPGENDEKSLDKTPQKDCSCEKSSSEKESQEGVDPQTASPPPIEITLDQALFSSRETPDSWEVQRKGEEVIRVWIAPYEDEEKNYHSGMYLYSVLAPGAWEKKE